MADNNTQQFVDIEEFYDFMTYLKNGSFRSVLEVSSMNFELKSSDEKTAIIFRFQDLLNSLDFPLQIMIWSRELDLTHYLEEIEKLSQTINNELLRIQLIEYKRFVGGLTELSNIMTKKFYVVIPVFPNIVTTKKGGLFKKKAPTGLNFSTEEIEKYSILMRQRIDLVLNLLSGIGLTAEILKKDDLANLYYSFYNPESKEKLQLGETQ